MNYNTGRNLDNRHNRKLKSLLEELEETEDIDEREAIQRMIERDEVAYDFAVDMAIEKKLTRED